jgi:predicted lipoprotein with Yx(FWY)xxD motif
MASARVRHILATAASAGAVLAIAACGASPTATPAANQRQLQQQPPAVAAPTGTVPVDDAPAAAGTGDKASALKVVEAGALGSVVVNGAGKTLYRFDKDTPKPPKSNCADTCAEAWPPATISDAATYEGVDKALVGTIDRPDGIKQLTIGGWPMYEYAKDVKAGDITGEAVGGTWWASAPNGARAKDLGKAAAPGTTVLKAMDVKPFGKVLADSKGFTLYRFEKDGVNPKTSACNGECAKLWPPVKAEDNIVAEGIDKSIIGSVTRDDGTKQLTVGGWLVYNYAKDTAPCQSNGEGVGGTWFVSAPDGKKANAKVAK